MNFYQVTHCLNHLMKMIEKSQVSDERIFLLINKYSIYLTDNKNYYEYIDKKFITPLGFLNQIKEDMCSQIVPPVVPPVVPPLPTQVIKDFMTDLCDTIYTKL